MTHPLGLDGVVELAVLERSGLIESRHLGAAVVVGPRGTSAHGDVDAAVYGRSTLKFMQAIAVLDSGVDLVGEQLVLAAASHSGTDRHVAVVRAILARAGLDEDALQCPEDWPLSRGARSAASATTRITMNCSGKHAAFLLACVTNGWPTASYLDPSHPLQQAIRSTVERYTGEVIKHSGVDGCGAPVFAITLRGLATAVGSISGATPQTDAAAARLSAAILANPWALDSPAIARVIGELGLIAKNGAEGVFVAGCPDGTAVAHKMLDGSTRASIAVGLSLLAAAGAIPTAAAADIAAAVTEQVLGGGLPVGSIRPTR